MFWTKKKNERTNHTRIALYVWLTKVDFMSQHNILNFLWSIILCLFYGRGGGSSTGTSSQCALSGQRYRKKDSEAKQENRAKLPKITGYFIKKDANSLGAEEGGDGCWLKRWLILYCQKQPQCVVCCCFLLGKLSWNLK